MSPIRLSPIFLVLFVANTSRSHIFLFQLDNVRTEHYETFFHCRANNSYGSDSHVLRLVPPGRPDAPADVHVVQTAADAVTLGWRPGFDGGHNQTYVLTVLYQKTSELLREEELRPEREPGAYGGWYLNWTTVTDLQVGNWGGSHCKLLSYLL